MGNTTFIVWRESIEAMLIIAILYAWLKNQSSGDYKKGIKYLWGGVLGGLLFALLLGFIMLGIESELASEALDFFQLGMLLCASALIVQMVFWMRKKGKDLKKSLEENMQQAQQKANWWGIFILVSIAVGREGAETTIFLYGNAIAHQNDLSSFILAVLTGFILALLSFFILSSGSKFFSWQHFFRLSEILLLLLACALLGSATDMLIGMGYLPALIDPVWDSSFLIDDMSKTGSVIASLTGYRSQPALTLLLAYLVYWGVIGLFFHKQKVR